MIIEWGACRVIVDNNFAAKLKLRLKLVKNRKQYENVETKKMDLLRSKRNCVTRRKTELD